MLFDKLDTNKHYDYTLILTTKNQVPIAILGEAFNKDLTRTMDGIDVFKFDIPYYVDEFISHRRIENPYYHNVRTENLVLLKVGDPKTPVWQSYFTIKEAQIQSDPLTKSVICNSREDTLNKIQFSSNSIERSLYDTQNNDGILNLLEQETSWKVGYVQPSALLDNINGGTTPKYRYIGASDEGWYSFLHDTIETAYNVLFIFNSYNKTIDVYDRNGFGKQTNLLLCSDNYVKNFNRTEKSENVCTALNVTGKDGITIESVNVYGNSMVYNYDYYIKSGQMSSELVNAWNTYTQIVTEKDTEYQALVLQMNTLNTQLDTVQSNLTAAQEKLKADLHIQTAYIVSNDNTNLPGATNTVNADNANISSLQTQVNSLQSQITNISTQMTNIINSIQKNAVKDHNGNLIFNSALLSELEDWTYTENWSSENYTSPYLLKQVSQRLLDKEYSFPDIEYSMDLVDFLHLANKQRYWGEINIGDLVRNYSKEFNINENSRIIGYEHNIDTASLTLQFSNKDLNTMDKNGLGSIIKKATTTSNIVMKERDNWDTIKDTNNAVSEFLNNALDVDKQAVTAENNDNKIDITENGITIASVSNANNQLKIVNNCIAFTSDGWQSTQTAIDHEGIFARFLVGQIILSEQLFVADTTGQLSMVGNLLQIRDSSGNVKLKIGQYDSTHWGIAVLDSSGNIVMSNDEIVCGKIKVSGTIDGNVCNLVNLNASHINTGTLDGNTVSVINLNADNLTTGTFRLATHVITTDGYDIFIDNHGIRNNIGGTTNIYKSLVHVGSGNLGGEIGQSWSLNIQLPSSFAGRQFDAFCMPSQIQTDGTGMTQMLLNVTNKNTSNATFTVEGNLGGTGSSNTPSSILNFTYIAIGG